MNQDLLKIKGLNPQLIQTAYLPGFQLKIGTRATLVPQKGTRSYGVVMELEEHELKHLYSSESVKDYQPETVQVITMGDEILKSSTYLLPIQKLSGSNSEYAIKLVAEAKKFDFPNDYIEEIKSWI